MESTHKIVQETKTSDLKNIFDLQRKNQYNIGRSTVAERKQKLKNLHEAVLKYRPQIKEALYKDFRKHPSEVDLTDIYPVTSEIKNALKNIHRWMKPKKVATPTALIGSSSYIQYEPKGVVLIISPWNFPVNLTFGPLVGAIAAGNAVMIKPSENTPYASALMKNIIGEIFNENEVALVEGGVETSKSLLDLPFNHIFFTGAPSIGKIVMQSAARHLASVTLELGGKSPTIVDQTADIDTAAKRIAWGKFVNNGQVCLAPDHVYVHESKMDVFLEAIKKYVKSFYSDNPSQETSYARIVNSRHFKRIKHYLDDAIGKGAKVAIGGETLSDQDYIAPTILTNVPDDAVIENEEIFGPLLPIHGFTKLQEVIDDINSKEKPLGLYLYSKSRKNIDLVLNGTRAGGSCINHNTVHYFNHNLPFGGVNNSGIGKGHGWHSFEAFSNARGVLTQHVPNALEKLLPPYNRAKQKLIDMTIKYF